MKTMRPVTLSGTVARFKGNGRRLGYPTANLAIETGLADGVYFGFADLQDWSGQPALVFVGTPTTVGDTGRRVEVHLLDIPDEDYYGLPLAVTVRHYHRANKTFADIGQLTEAIKGDEVSARRWFAAHPNS
jgi:riboflavin kinase / FMN adenylyltransferase